MSAAGPVPYLVLAGDPEEIGLAHGAALGPRLRNFISDGRARLDYLMTPPGDLDVMLDAYDAAITEQVPELTAEINGLARGAGITRREAILLQTRRELLGYQRVPTRGDCTTYARRGGEGIAPVLAQTVDLNGDLDDQIAVLRVIRKGTGRQTLVLSFGGQLGYLGINDAGLAVGINLVLAGAWGPGLPPYLAIRHVLDHASSVNEAIGLIRSCYLASSRTLVLCDARTTAVVEFPGAGSGSAAAVEVGPEFAHTNHFLNPGLAAVDELNVFARNSSQRRLDTCHKRLNELPPNAGPEDHMALLSTAPINVAPTADIRTERTVAAVVLRPEQGELHLRPGDPAGVATQVYALHRAHRSAEVVT